jgi:thymidylate synthase (FAD)
MIALDRCVFQPVVTKIGGSQLDVGGIGVAIDQIGAEEAAEKEGTPLNSLYSRLALDANDVAGIGPSGAAGTGDDIAEFSGRQCYRSWNAGRGPEDYIGNVIEEGHGSVFEHAQVIFQVTGVSRSLTHELIRHSIGIGYSQESQRYVDAKDMMFVVPPMVCNHLKANTHMSEAEMELDLVLGQFRRSCRLALDAYVEAQDMYREILSAQGLTGRLLKKRVNEAAPCRTPARPVWSPRSTSAPSGTS